MRSSNFRVVLTGGIASGKSTVAQEFAALDVPIIDIDQIGREVVEPGTSALQQIVAEFGSDFLDATGRMDRRRMRERVFSIPEQRKKLEAIIWPAIRTEVERRSGTLAGPYQIHDIPLYVESGRKGDYDRILVVDCPDDIRVARLMQRDRIDSAAAAKILAAQVDRNQRLAAADDVITNDNNFDLLREQVHRLHKTYLQLAARKV